MVQDLDHFVAFNLPTEGGRADDFDCLFAGQVAFFHDSLSFWVPGLRYCLP